MLGSPTGSVLLTIALGTLAIIAGCESDAKWVDDRLDKILETSATDIGGNAEVPPVDGWMAGTGTAFPPDRPIDNRPPTNNPSAEDLYYQAMTEVEKDADSIIERMQEMAVPPEDAVVLTLEASIKYATKHALDYVNA
ncbi:hypothetical protein MK489_25165, partial [Myxococcota bacterium]|nr:hypothetical protein [Myxococcota bacterium]